MSADTNQSAKQSTPKNNIAALRQQKGLTQAYLAEQLGVSRPTYSRIEAGEKEITVSQVQTLLRILDATFEDLLSIDIPTEDPLESAEKYKQIILVCIKYGADPDGRITKTKLAKLVYLADFSWYFIYGEPMSSGVVYRKLPQGPVADLYFRTLDEMEDDGFIRREPRGRAIMFSLVEPNTPMAKISHDEHDLIRRICSAWRHKSTDDIVNFTHAQAPWRESQDGAPISYNLIYWEHIDDVFAPGVLVHQPGPTLLRALKEAETLSRDPHAKGYRTMEELLAALDEE